jgi:hypothetical protein
MPAMAGVRGRHTAAQLPLDALRDLEVVRRYEAGEALAGIGAAMGLTRERIRQIVKASRAAMPSDYVYAAPDCSTAPRSPNRFCYPHERRFERFGDPLGSKPRVMDQHGTLASYKRGRCSCELCRKCYAERVREYQHRMHPELRRYKPRSNF